MLKQAEKVVAFRYLWFHHPDRPSGSASQTSNLWIHMLQRNLSIDISVKWQHLSLL